MKKNRWAAVLKTIEDFSGLLFVPCLVVVVWMGFRIGSVYGGG